MLPKERDGALVEAHLKKYGVDFHFYFEDLDDGTKIELGVKKSYPFASCFKLAVLGSVLEQSQKNSLLSENIDINEGDIPALAMGVVNYLDPPIRLNVSNLCRLMMSFSDGASTDLLIKRVGIESVRKFIADCTQNSKVTHDVRGLLDELLKTSLNVASDPKNITRLEYLEALKLSTMKQDYSDAKDVALILKKLVNMGPDAHRYLFKDQGTQRLGMYSLDHIRLYGKSGTLGYWISANDSAVLVINGKPRAVMALMTLGWNQPRYIIEHAFGEVGLMISNWYREQPVYSPAFGS